MKAAIFILALFYIVGCVSTSSVYTPPARDKQKPRWWLYAPDGSSSPISQERAWAIAKAEVARREHWPEGKVGRDHLIHTVSYDATRVDNGGWCVIARRAVTEGRLDGGGGCAYDPIPAAIILINNKGVVSDYSRKIVAE